MEKEINLKGIYLSDLIEVKDFIEVADLLTKKAQDIEQEAKEKTKIEAQKKRSQDKLNKQKEEIQKDIDKLDQHIAKTDQELEGLYEDRQREVEIISSELPSDEALKDITAGGLIDKILKQPVKQHNSNQREMSIKRLELHKENLLKIKKEKVVKKDTLIQGEADREKNLDRLMKEGHINKMKTDLMESLDDCLAYYRQVEDSFLDIKKTLFDLNILDPSPWFDRAVENKGWVQMLGGPLRAGYADKLTLFDFIGYCNTHGLFGDRDNHTFYNRRVTLKHSLDSFESAQEGAMQTEETLDKALDQALEQSPTLEDEAPTIGGDAAGLLTGEIATL